MNDDSVTIPNYEYIPHGLDAEELLIKLSILINAYWKPKLSSLRVRSSNEPHAINSAVLDGRSIQLNACIHDLEYLLEHAELLTNTGTDFAPLV